MDFDPRDHSQHHDRETEGIYDWRWGEEIRDSFVRETDIRDHDPRDPFVRSVDLPRGLERELVQDTRERLYELNGDDSRMLATIGAFRVVAEGDLEGFRDAGTASNISARKGLIRSVSWATTKRPSC